MNCRLDEIDAPETAKPRYNKPGQPFAEEAKKSLEKMILNKEVNVTVVEFPTEKNNGRHLCRIEVEGKDVNLQMVKDGLAWLYSSRAAPFAFTKAEAVARNKGKGLWSDPNPINPREFKNQKSD